MDDANAFPCESVVLIDLLAELESPDSGLFMK